MSVVSEAAHGRSNLIIGNVPVRFIFGITICPLISVVLSSLVIGVLVWLSLAENALCDSSNTDVQNTMSFLQY